MPHRTAPDPLPRGAAHRRTYRLHSLAGLALALVLLLIVFTVPVVAGEPDALPPVEDDVFTLIDEIPPTDLQAPPPPPPPAPPPPVEVENDAEVEDTIAELVLETEFEVPLPSPPAPPPAPPVAPPTPPTPPPAPPVVEPTDEIIEFLPIEDAPKLIGGLDGLQSRVVYPELAKRADIDGVVFIQFVVDEAGRVVDPVVTRSPSDLLSDAALDALRASRFTPGQQRGRPVKVRYALPVRFVLR